MRSRVAVLGGTAILLLSLAAGAASAASHTPQIDLSRARGVQSEPSIAVDAGNPNLLVAASQDSGICGIRTYASADGGRKWSSTPLSVSDPVAARHSAAEFCAVNEWVAAGRDGWQYVVFLEKSVAGWQLAFSARQYPQRWSAPSPLSDGIRHGADARHLLLCRLADRRPHVVTRRRRSLGAVGRVAAGRSQPAGLRRQRLRPVRGAGRERRCRPSGLDGLAQTEVPERGDLHDADQRLGQRPSLGTSSVSLGVDRP